MVAVQQKVLIIDDTVDIVGGLVQPERQHLTALCFVRHHLVSQLSIRVANHKRRIANAVGRDGDFLNILNRVDDLPIFFIIPNGEGGGVLHRLAGEGLKIAVGVHQIVRLPRQGREVGRTVVHKALRAVGQRKGHAEHTKPKEKPSGLFHLPQPFAINFFDTFIVPERA